MKIIKLLFLLSFCWIALAMPSDAALQGSVRLNDNAAPQDGTCTNNLQAEVDAVIPPAPNRFTLRTGQQHLMSDLATQQFSQPRLEPKQAVIVHLLPRQQQLQSNIQHQLSAIGIQWNMATLVIQYVDLNSDLYGNIQCGDVFLSLNGLSPQQGLVLKTNFGNEQTLVDLRFVHNHQYLNITCHRHPVAWFTPGFQQLLMSCY